MKGCKRNPFLHGGKEWATRVAKTGAGEEHSPSFSGCPETSSCSGAAVIPVFLLLGAKFFPAELSVHEPKYLDCRDRTVPKNE